MNEAAELQQLVGEVKEPCAARLRSFENETMRHSASLLKQQRA